MTNIWILFFVVGKKNRNGGDETTGRLEFFYRNCAVNASAITGTCRNETSKAITKVILRVIFPVFLFASFLVVAAAGQITWLPRSIMSLNLVNGSIIRKTETPLINFLFSTRLLSVLQEICSCNSNYCNHSDSLEPQHVGVFLSIMAALLMLQFWNLRDLKNDYIAWRGKKPRLFNIRLFFLKTAVLYETSLHPPLPQVLPFWSGSC